ncbi:MAG: tRNA lysidine(34) synthetase TilS [Candidatus Gastranaerophilales bacterium]|nr:tRNA lysidine(34) synthetase TilS [Candidatus Gastranaerophilales bacterium]
MSKIRETIKSFLYKYDLDKPDLVYLIAFSGGYDSMCLLDVLHHTVKNKIIAIHLNHKWRGEESDQEELNCKTFCQTRGIEFYSENLSKDIAKTETAARNARYDFFERCAKKFNSCTIFTAHNKNDNAETLIYRIATGTGISGLQGINEQRGIFYRPLLDVTRNEIESYCKKQNLNPNNDSSNSDTKYKRNFIRANIMPALCKINKNALDSINSLSEIAKDESEIIEEYLNHILIKISDNNKILTNKFLNLSTPVQKRIIYNMFIKQNLDYDRKKISNILEFIKENANSKSGKTCSLTNDLWLFSSNKHIEIITKNIQQIQPLHITKEGIYQFNGYIFELEKFEKEVKKFPKDSEQIAYVQISTPIDFELRTRLEGDIIKPFGLKGSQKLKKYLNEKKIPNHEKDNLLFLARDNEILWAIGLGISDKIKISKKATHRMKFYKEGENGN